MNGCLMSDGDGPWSARYRGFSVGIERTLADVECFSANAKPTPQFSRGVSLGEIVGINTAARRGTYPGNFSVLFIEYAKCFPRDVKSNGR